MLNKLQSRYDQNQLDFLSHCTFLDPRFKKYVIDIDSQAFIDRVTNIAMNYTEIIQGTESQGLQNIENPAFTHTRRKEPQASSNTGENQNNVQDIFMDDDSDDDENAITSTHAHSRKISAEIDIYKNISMKGDEKKKPCCN